MVCARTPKAFMAARLVQPEPDPQGLEEYQRIGLINAHQRLEAGGGAAYPEVVANEGTQGLLKAFADPTYANRDRNNGVQNAAVFL